MSEAQYIEPNQKARIFMWFSIILFMGLNFLILPISDYLSPSQYASINEREENTRLAFKLFFGGYSLQLILVGFWAIYFGGLGYRTLKFKNFPPPDSIMFIRSHLLTGKKAIKAGYLSIIFALTAGILTIFTGYMLSETHSAIDELVGWNKTEKVSPEILKKSTTANWKFLRETSEGASRSHTTYIAPDFIHVSDDKVKMWILSDYDTDQPYDKKYYRSFKAYVEYDCDKKKSRTLYSSFHHKSMGKGEIINSDDRPYHWSTVHSHGPINANWKYACKKS